MAEKVQECVQCVAFTQGCLVLGNLLKAVWQQEHKVNTLPLVPFLRLQQLLIDLQHLTLPA